MWKGLCYISEDIWKSTIVIGLHASFTGTRQLSKTYMLVVDFVTLIMINNMDHIDNNKFTLKQIGDTIVGAHYLPTRTIYY